MEIKQHPTYPVFVVSNGAIYDLMGMSLPETTISKERPAVHLNGQPVVVARLVAEAFIPNPEGARLVLHTNGNQQDNDWSNLRWGSWKDNAADSLAHGTFPRGERHGKALMTEEKVINLRKMWDKREATQLQLAAKFDISRSAVQQILARRTWTHV